MTNEIGNAIASAATEQAAAVGEIPRDASEAAGGQQDVSANVARILAASARTGWDPARFLAAAAEFATQFLSGKQEVDGFLHAIQAT